MKDMEPTRDVKGRVCNIQKFSIHDGPGLRTTVFLKGCPLRCAWCANPESQSLEPQMMDGEPDSRERTVREVVKVCLQDRDFYEESGGGVTISGGEPFMQADFLRALLAAFHEEGIRTAIETAGFVDEGLFTEISVHTDLLLFDIKHFNAEAHKRGTGLDNARILTNFDAALSASGGPEVLPRIPVIPGFNASNEDAAGLADLLQAHGADRAQLLPFHQLGDKKYTLLGRPYSLHGVKPLYREDLEEYRKVFTDRGIAAFF
jgi:pyruvate formate lyase activating enzyme